MHTPRRTLLLAALATTVAIAPAYGHHSAPATYMGSIAGGGMVEFDVSADGSAITRFKTLDVVRSPCTFSDTEVLGPFPIANHAFQGGDAAFSFTGTFHAAQAAQGTVTIAPPTAPSCASGQLSWSATTTAPPGAAPSPPPGAPGAAPADTTAPHMTIAAPSPQRVDRKGRIALRVGCAGEACEATAAGTLSVPGAGATFRLGPVARGVARGKRATLALGLSKRARVAVRRALARGRRVRATVTVTVADAAGNRSQAKRTIRLRR